MTSEPQTEPQGSQYAAPTSNELAAILNASMIREPAEVPQTAEMLQPEAIHDAAVQTDASLQQEPAAGAPEVPADVAPAPMEIPAPTPEDPQPVQQLEIAGAPAVEQQTEAPQHPVEPPVFEETQQIGQADPVTGVQAPVEPQHLVDSQPIFEPQEYEQPQEPELAAPQAEPYIAPEPAPVPETPVMEVPPSDIAVQSEPATPEPIAAPQAVEIPEQQVAVEVPTATAAEAVHVEDTALPRHEETVNLEAPADHGDIIVETQPAAAAPDASPEPASELADGILEIETDLAPVPRLVGGDDDPPVGTVISISGSKATVLLDKLKTGEDGEDQICPHIGTVLTVDTGVAVVLCLITGMSVPDSAVEKADTGTRIVEVDLVGELVREDDGYLRTLRRGCSVYPKLGDPLHVASHIVLEKAYHFNAFNSVAIGTIHQDPSIPAVVKVDDMLGKHFAIVGSTGSGKSCTVALLLRQVLSKHPNAHVVLLDPHNEYDSCFGKASEIVRLSDLSLPFWFLNFEELVEILIGNTKGREEEVEILRDVIPYAKRQFGEKRDQSAAVMLQRSVGNREKYTVDVPVPYRISDVLRLIDTQMGRLEVRRELSAFKRLKARIETISQDPRYDFMFGSLTIQDNLADILKRLFRIPVNGKPITVIQLMGLPAEIVNVVVSVLARLAFDLALWSDGKMPITFVCEEAHRYVPRDTGLGFEPTKRAISRIAKEGRKYGVSLCVVSQRPGDLDPTILSQCSTLFTMRLSNERDQEIIRSALPDAAESLIDFLPSLGTRETIVFGEGVTLPSHILLSELPEHTLPKGNTAGFTDAWSADISDASFVDEVVSRWRVIGQLPDSGNHDADVAAEAAAAQDAEPAAGASDQAAPAANGVANGHSQDPALQAAQNGAAPQQPAQAQAVPQQPAAPAQAHPTPSPEAMPVFPEIPPLPEMPPLRPAAPQPQAAAPIAQPRAPQPKPAAPSQSTNSTIAEALAERFKKLNF